MSAVSEAKPAASHLCLRDVEWLGFDLDHTIVRYHLPALNELVFQCIGNYLVNKRKFDKAIVERGFRASFPLRGMVLDAVKGNFLVLSASGKVLTGSHGTRKMDEEELKCVYPDGLPEVAEKTRRNEKLKAFHAFTTFFDLPTSVLLAHYVDLCDEQGTDTYIRIAMELLGAFEFCFNPENEVEGGYFCEIKAHPDKYLIKCTDRVKSWLQSAHKHQVGLFLLTNSLSGYTDFLLNHCYGRDWREVFDLVIVGGKKPDFFTKIDDSAHAFHAVSEHLVGDPVGPEALVRGGFVAHGNLRDLMPFLARHGRGAQLEAKSNAQNHQQKTPAPLSSSLKADPESSSASHPPSTTTTESAPAVAAAPSENVAPTVLRDTSVVYFGDHPLGDVAAASGHSSWQAVAILEEMLERESTHTPSDPALAAADTEARQFLRAAFDHWGHFYHFEAVENETTLFEQVLFDFSAFVVPHLDAIAAYPLAHQFRVVAPNEPRAGLHYFVTDNPVACTCSCV
eukprot:m.65785 g.65785  ORF g.65785 m.65785 type:complete len:509 (-) comp12623_c0_seq1:116-1642(-)